MLQIMIPIIAFLLSCSALFSSPILLRSHHLHILSLKFLLNLMAPASLPILLLRLSLQQRPFKSPPLQHTGDLLHAPCPASTTCMHEPMHCTLTPMQDPKSQFSGSALLISTPSAFLSSIPLLVSTSNRSTLHISAEYLILIGPTYLLNMDQVEVRHVMYAEFFIFRG
jgi:hypothetical protein